jgi:hypothetical protein
VNVDEIPSASVFLSSHSGFAVTEVVAVCVRRCSAV